MPRSIRKCSVALALVTLLATSRSLPAADGCDAQKRPVTEIGERYQLGQSLSAAAPPLPIVHAEARYLRALVELSADAGCDWSLVVRDGSFRPLQILKRSDFTGRTRWTERIAGNRLILDVEHCSGVSPSFIIQEYVEMPASTKNPYYSLKDPSHPTYQDLYQSEVMNPGSLVVSNSLKRLGDNVAFIMMSYDRRSWICSGVMLAEGILLTNYHCGGIEPLQAIQYWRGDIVRDLLADISWDGDAVSREYGGVRYLAGNSSLDYAMVEVRRLNGRGPVDPVRVWGTDTPADAAAIVPLDNPVPLFLIHHPAGSVKQLSQSCRVTANQINHTSYSPGAEFGHDCDSEKGSSGGAVFDKAGTLIGLHHDGFKQDDSCRQLDTDNKAVSLPRILAHAEADPNLPEIYKQLLRGLPKAAVPAH